MSKDLNPERRSGLLRTDLADEFARPLERLDLPGRMTLRELASRAPESGLPDTGEYAVYAVATDAEGKEHIERLPAETRLDEIEMPEDGILRLRYAQALRGA